jgi:hypothetical protein
MRAAAHRMAGPRCCRRAGTATTNACACCGSLGLRCNLRASKQRGRLPTSRPGTVPPSPASANAPCRRHPATHTHTPLPPARPRLPKGVTSPHVNSTGAEVCYSTMIHDSHDDRFALCVDVCRRMVFTERKAQAAGQGDRLKGAPGLSEIPMRSLYS